MIPSTPLHAKEPADSVGMLRERVSAFVAEPVERDVTVTEADCLVSKELKVREGLCLLDCASSGRKLFPSLELGRSVSTSLICSRLA